MTLAVPPPAALLSPGMLADLEGEARANEQAATALAAVTLTTDVDLVKVSEIVKQAKVRWAELEEQRKAISGPLHAAFVESNAPFKRAQDPLKRVEALLKGKIEAYTLAQRAAQRAAVAEVAAQASAGRPVDLTVLAPVARPEGITVRERWDVEVVDPDLVPRDFCSPDLDKLKASRDWSAYSAERPPPAIPGVRFVLRGQVSARTAS